MKKTGTQFHKDVIWCRNGDRSIYGVAFLPLEGGQHPLVIFSHELGNNHRSGIPYAKRLAAMGYAVYTYDFCGGSVAGNRSDGKTTEMTVSTEVSDLETVLTAARTWGACGYGAYRADGRKPGRSRVHSGGIGISGRGQGADSAIPGIQRREPRSLHVSVP